MLCIKTACNVQRFHETVAATERLQHDIQAAYTTLKMIFQNFAGPFMSMFHVSPGLLNRVDAEQLRFCIHLLKRLNTMITYVKAENVYTDTKCSNQMVYFP